MLTAVRHCARRYEERACELLEAMRQRHELDARELHKRYAAQSGQMRASPRLLDLRKIEQRLAKQGAYAKAQTVKEDGDALEAAERERATAERAQQLAKAEAGLLHRQDQEVDALRQRIQAGAEEQRVTRQQDLERLLKRYTNLKTELVNQQNAERARLKKGLTTLPGSLRPLSAARVSSSSSWSADQRQRTPRGAFGGAGAPGGRSLGSSSSVSSSSTPSRSTPRSTSARPASARFR
jgi:hypothetical protein